MASGVVTAPISISLADFLATAVSDGTYADIVSVTKTDAASPGPTPASQIEEYCGQLYGNLVDDLWLVNYQAQYKAAKWWTVADATAKLALGSDDALAVNDLLFQVSDKTLWYCTAVTGGGTSTWTVIGALGDMTGPGSSTDEALARFDGATGKLVQNGVALLTDAGALSGLTDITLSGTVDGRDVATDGATLDSHVADMANPHMSNLAGTLAAGSTTTGSDLEVSAGDALLMNENTTVPGGAPAAGKGTVWVKDDAPNSLIYTDDGGTDHDLSAGSSGDVAGPGSSTDEALARFDGATGKILQNGVILASDTGVMTGVLTVNGVTVENHDTRHENGGADEIDVTDLSGLLADPQTAIAAAGSDTTAIHVDVAHEIDAILNKAAPIGSDVMLIEDSADDGEKKHILISALPVGTANTLAATLTAGNTTGGTGIIITNNDSIEASTEASPADFVIKGGTATAAAGGDVHLLAGDPSAGLPGGDVHLIGSDAISGLASGGDVHLFGGTAAGAGLGGGIFINCGNSPSGTGGSFAVDAGAGGGAGEGGLIALTCGPGGATNAAGGIFQAEAGAGGGTAAGGAANFFGGIGGSSSGTGGFTTLRAGDGGATNGPGGGVLIRGGDATGTSGGGALTINSGNGGGTSGNSGDIIITPGTVTSGTVGEIQMDALKVRVDRMQHDYGTALVAGDFALHANWGTTASVSSISGTDSRFAMTILSTGTGQGTAPTITLTYTDGAWPNAPFPMLIDNGSFRNDGTFINPSFELTSRTTTTAVWTLNNAVSSAATVYTPISTDTFQLIVAVIG